MLNTTVTSMLPSPERMSTTLAALVLSSPVVGSSRNMIPGLVSSSVAMLTRRFSPPLSPRVNWSPMNECATFVNPSSRIHPTTHRYTVSFPVPSGSLSMALKSRCSHTVEVPGSTSSCCTYPLTLRTSCGPTRQPSRRTSPCATWPRGVRPARKSSRVDLPAPDGPSIANNPDVPPPLPPLPPPPLRLGTLPRCRAAAYDPRVSDTGATLAPADTLAASGPANPELPRRMCLMTPPGCDGVMMVAYTQTCSQLRTIAAPCVPPFPPSPSPPPISTRSRLPLPLSPPRSRSSATATDAAAEFTPPPPLRWPPPSTTDGVRI
mmetsp:Transcript_25123/g.62896  ORF Transcript_25123/g.62896 Transcript_25123/m.62896 type:complete len:320 (-) Transcript_25123:378-1337(-)